jgi:hypothetical protein
MCGVFGHATDKIHADFLVSFGSNLLELLSGDAETLQFTEDGGEVNRNVAIRL